MFKVYLLCMLNILSVTINVWYSLAIFDIGPTQLKSGLVAQTMCDAHVVTLLMGWMNYTTKVIDLKCNLSYYIGTMQ